MKLSRKIKILSGPLAAFIVLFFTDLDPDNPFVTRMAAVTIWVAIWWLTEAVHLAVTALLPFLLIPPLGIVSPKEIAFQYMDPIIFLFIGGFLISFAIERWQLHKRIAYRILMLVGTKSHNILLGVMITSYLISMWISNTATVMMLISAVLAIIAMLDKSDDSDHNKKNISKAILIGLAYSASIGGMATLVGTPPNMVFFRAYSESYPEGTPMSFARWFIYGLPVSILLFTACYFFLKSMFLKKAKQTGLNKNYFIDSYKSLGKKTIEQKIVTVVFCSTALLWFTRSDLILGNFTLPGWNRIFENPGFITDSFVAILMALLLFIIPSKSEKGKFLLNWSEAKNLPFEIILLFGSGFALAKGFDESGLSTWMASKLELFKNADILIIGFSLAVLVCLISEFASNVASIQLMIPVLIALQLKLEIDPLLLMIPATLAASTGFMLPVATAPNTIVFGSGKITIMDMARAGYRLDIAGILIITLLIYFLK